MSIAENKTLVERYIGDVWNGRRLDDIDELFQPEYTVHQGAQTFGISRELLKQSITTLLAAFPDFHMTLDYLVAEGDKVAAYWINHGAQTGELRLPDLPRPAPASGREATFTESALFRIANGQIAEVWYVSDRLSMLQQLGLISWTNPQS